ncbi:GntR family transcriptional regulator [Streptomyces sp. NBC_01306]|uniref:GntR family transcriptional regulator n=1 Tax=Streptomyces sp. NBC_01306 TaxID=2903819 RepID=UPI002251A8B1|nr:GntR family transcriptional regulator [Streptomyces sp. NBC_01306]MCX4725522.1 GntR family transcriptional regulator [Streptomyces sp. NBC_01306]
MIEFRIDRRSGVSTYLQIAQQTKQALRLGLLQPGDQLPTARAVVESTAINPNTVLKAYRELEREGLVEARRGMGTFIRKSLGHTPPADSALRAELTEWAARARTAGLEKDDAAALCASVLDDCFQDTAGTTGATATTGSTGTTAASDTHIHTRATTDAARSKGDMHT